MLGTFIKIYPIVRIGVLFFSKAESEIISLLSFLGIGLLCDPGTLYTEGVEYVISQYIDWFERLKVKKYVEYVR